MRKHCLTVLWKQKGYKTANKYNPNFIKICTYKWQWICQCLFLGAEIKGYFYVVFTRVYIYYQKYSKVIAISL